MKRIFFLLLALSLVTGIREAAAGNEERQLPVFTEISLRVAATLYVEQGSEQKVTLEASEATLEQLITEVNGRALIIRFPAKNWLTRNFNPGKITIRVTMPEVTALNLAGSGDIIAREGISSLILDLNVSGSGSIDLQQLDAERVKASISGSGNIHIGSGKPATELTVAVSGSGNLKAADLEAALVKVTIAGSGNATVRSNGNIDVKIAGSGNLYYSGNPNVNSTIAGSGEVREIH